MGGPRLEKEDFLYLNKNLPADVVRVVTAHSVKAYNIITGGDIENPISLREAIETIENNIFYNKPLPNNFPIEIGPFWVNDFILDSDDVGIFVGKDYGEENEKKVLEWFYRSLATQNNMNLEYIKKIFTEGDRAWFDGKMSLKILANS